MIFNVYKQKGETPLECLQRFREAFPEHDQKKPLDKERVKWTYAGRLDPLADGVLLLLNKEDTKRKEDFIGLDKEYDFTVVFGFATDTYDVLGKITTSNFENVSSEKSSGLLRPDEDEIRTGLGQTISSESFQNSKRDDFELNEMDLIKIAKLFEGTYMQKYPPFSSKTVGGKALHELARNDLIMEEDLPEREVTIHSLLFKNIQRLKAKEFFGRLLMDIGRVKGDFRQNQILILWRKALFGDTNNSPNSSYSKRGIETSITLANFHAHVSSGTYIRALAKRMGETLGIPACILSITRTRVGDYRLEDSIRF